MTKRLQTVVDQGRTVAWIIGALGTLGIMVLLVWVLVQATRPEDLTAARTRERIQFLAEVTQADAELLSAYAWQDRDKGLVRVPVERAIELMVREWQQPASARAEMVARVEMATAPPPEPENPYE